MRVVTKRMSDKPEICASALLLPVALILAACQPGAVPQSLAATPQWIAYTYLDGEKVYAPQRLAQPPTPGSFSETEFERTPEGTRLRTVLRDGTLYVYLDVDQIWTSDPSWEIRQMLVADLDDDGQDEAAFVVWKPLTLEPGASTTFSASSHLLWKAARGTISFSMVGETVNGAPRGAVLLSPIPYT